MIKLIMRWLVNRLEKKQDYYQKLLEQVDYQAWQRAKEVNYDYSNNIEEMVYLFDRIDYLKQKRNFYRSKAGSIAAKLKWE